jgi:Tol biopolymer transport system component
MASLADGIQTRARTRFVLLVLATLIAAAPAALVPVPATSAARTNAGHNGMLVFAGDLGQGSEIFVIDARGRGFTQLTDEAGEATSPDWSPNGARIAFQLDHDETADIAVMRADGGGLHVLDLPGYQAQPAFTADGTRLVFECGECDGRNGIFVMDLDGTQPQRLTTNPFQDEGDSDPNVSPDGSTVTFVRHLVDGKLQALFAVDIDGTNLRKLVDYGREVAVKHDWAPDGAHIVITTAADYPHHRSPNIATIRADGTHLRFLTHFRGGRWGAFAGSYSPNGEWIVYRIENLDSERYVMMKMHPDGSHKTRIAAMPFRPRGTDWAVR